MEFRGKEFLKKDQYYQASFFFNIKGEKTATLKNY